jgi:hypothetical protein
MLTHQDIIGIAKLVLELAHWLALIVIWLVTRQAARKQQIDALASRVDKMEVAVASAPTHAQLAALSQRLIELSGAIDKSAAEIQGATKTLEAQLEGLDTGLGAVTAQLRMLQQHLLNNPKGS